MEIEDKKKIYTFEETVQFAIELGLNIMAQDLVWKKHSEDDIKKYINRFKYSIK